MSGIIKAAEAGSVRSFALEAVGGHIAEPLASPVRSAAEVALDEALEEIASLQAKLLAADKARRDECDETYAAGLKEGAKVAEDDTERRLASARELAEVALVSWRDRLGEMDVLAALLARGAVAKVFSPHADLADLVGRAISAKVARLRKQSVVVVRVSSKDFATSDDVAAASEGFEIMLDPMLKSGECRIDLRLGEVDLTIDGLAVELDDFFHSLGEPA